MVDLHLPVNSAYLGLLRVPFLLIITLRICCEFDSHPWQDVLDTTLCDRVCQ